MRLIIVAGMHRSGTSFVTELVTALGAHVGENLLEAAEDNPHGFFENRDVKQLNDTIIHRLGGTWDRPPVGLSASWAESSGFDRLRRSGETIVSDLLFEAGDSPACVVKDPRFSLTAPFWSSVASIDHTLVPVRSPRQVAQSLRHRNGFSTARSASLWLRYTVDSLLAAPNPILVRFEDLVSDPATAVRRLAADIGLDADVDDALALARERHRTWSPPETFTTVDSEPRMALAESLFGILGAVDDVGALTPILGRIAREWEVDPSGTSVAPTTGTRVSSTEAMAERYRDLHRELEDVRLRATDMADERNRARQEVRAVEEKYQKVVEERDASRAALAARERAVADHDEKIRTQRLRLADHERQLVELQNARRDAQARLEDEVARRSAAERQAGAERARREEFARVATMYKKRAATAEKNFRRLRDRRSVRLATRLASPFRPVFRTVRRVRRSVPSRPAASAERAPDPPVASETSGHSRHGDASIRKLFDEFPPGLDERTRTTLRAHLDARPGLADTLVSIVMPTYDRASQIVTAIDSVRHQTHATWELLVVDDGSADDTPAVMAAIVAQDDRVRYVRKGRGGVSRARNAALDMAQGSVIAFLDTDNTWDHEFLALMVAELDRTGAPIAYSAMQSRQNESVVSYRGDRFDYDEMLRGNYVDINVVCHRRDVAQGARFDTDLRRMVDWDYLLEIARGRDVSYAPFIGGSYTFHEAVDQISNSEPYLYRKIVAERHRDGAERLDAVSLFRRMELDIAIGLAAPRGKSHAWGDHHFGAGLAQALERLGHRATLYYHDEDVDGGHDLLISLRGLTGHEPPPQMLHVLWSISHPDLLDWDDIENCDVFLSTSLTWPRSLRWIVPGAHHVLPQATDRSRFHTHPEVSRTDEVLFVGNSRNADRPIVRRTAAAGVPLSVYGGRWDGWIPPEVVKGEYVPNEELSARYAAAGVVLNDHWESMRDHGYVSNRIYDVLASGGALLSDHLPSIPRIFGDWVATVGADDDIVDAVETARSAIVGTDAAQWVAEHHSLDERASSILAHVERQLFRGVGASTAPAGADGACPCTETTPTEQVEAASGARSGTRPVVVRGSANRIRVSFAPQVTRSGFSSSAYIRMVQPLTSEIDGVDVDLVRVDPDGSDVNAREALRGSDVFVVSRTALADVDTADEWLDAAESLSIPVVLDIDDAFHRMDETHPEFEHYRERIAALRSVIERADEIWCSTEALASSMPPSTAEVHVVPNSIDPRLWRRYREPDRAPGRDGDHGLELVYAGTATHARDLELVLDALDHLAEAARFRLTLIGVTSDAPDRPWLRRMTPRGGGPYPKYATWMRDIAPLFDVGVAPLVDSDFNRLKSDVKLLEYLALGFVTVASDTGPYRAQHRLVTGGACEDRSQWIQQLELLAHDPDALTDARRRTRVAADTVWSRRSAARTGSLLANRLVELVR